MSVFRLMGRVIELFFVFGITAALAAPAHDPCSPWRAFLPKGELAAQIRAIRVGGIEAEPDWAEKQAVYRKNVFEGLSTEQRAKLATQRVELGSEDFITLTRQWVESGEISDKGLAKSVRDMANQYYASLLSENKEWPEVAFSCLVKDFGSKGFPAVVASASLLNDPDFEIRRRGAWALKESTANIIANPGQFLGYQEHILATPDQIKSLRKILHDVLAYLSREEKSGLPSNDLAGNGLRGDLFQAVGNLMWAMRYAGFEDYRKVIPVLREMTGISGGNQVKYGFYDAPALVVRALISQPDFPVDVGDDLSDVLMSRIRLALSRNDMGLQDLPDVFQLLGWLLAHDRMSHAEYALPMLLDASRHQDRNVRYAALKALAGSSATRRVLQRDSVSSGAEAIGASEIFPVLLELLDAPEASVRAEGVLAWSKLPRYEPAVKRLISLLSDSDAYVRKEAARAISQLDPFPVEAQALFCHAAAFGSDEAPIVIRYLGSHPGDCGLPAVFKAFGRATMDGRRMDRHSYGGAVATIEIDFANEAAKALKKIGEPAISLLLAEIARSTDEKSLQAAYLVAYDILADHPGFEVEDRELSVLVDLLISGRETHRFLALSLLEQAYRNKIVPDRLAERVAEMFLYVPEGEPDRILRHRGMDVLGNERNRYHYIDAERSAIRLLANSRSLEAAEVMVKRLCSDSLWANDRHVELDQLSESLRSVGSAAIPALLQAIAGQCNRDAAGRLMEMLAFVDLSGGDEMLVAKFVTLSKENSFALISLRGVRLYPSVAMPLLREAVRSNGKAREVFALVYLDAVSGGELSSDEDAALVEQARQVLSDKVKLLRSGSDWEKYSAAELFSRLGLLFAPAVDALIDGLGDPSESVQISFAKALGEMKAVAAIPALETVARGGKEKVASEARSALERIRGAR